MVAELSAVPPQGVIPPSAQSPAPTSGTGQPAADGEFRLFGEDGFTFWDFLDIINPLQHIPVVSTIYRAVTGDEIDPGSRIGGGTLFGGPIGAAASVANVVLEHNTGKDMGDHVLALLDGGAAPVGVEVPPVQTAALTAASTAATPPIVPAAAAAQRQPFTAASGSQNAAGMSGIPIARPDAVAGYFKPATARTLPDLGLLGATAKAPVESSLVSAPAKLPADTTPAAASTSAISAATVSNTAATAAATTPNPATAISPATAPTSTVKSTTAATTPPTTAAPPNAQPIATAAPTSEPALAIQPTQRAASQISDATKDLSNNWVYDAMMQGLKKYETSARLARDVVAPGLSVVR